MTPREWNHVLDHKVEWSIAYPAVARAVQVLLRRVEWPGITTNGIVELLYPATRAVGDGWHARRRIFAALDALREHELADWCHQEEPTRARFGKMIRRVRWHQPQAVTEAEEVQTPEPSPAKGRRFHMGQTIAECDCPTPDICTAAERCVAVAPSPADLILAELRRMSQAGESHEMGARWIVEALRKHALIQA